MKGKLKQTKGITLIALIITIIVLLILAVVAIREVQGDGIISKAKKAKEDYENAQSEEQSTLDEYLSKIESNVPGGEVQGQWKQEGDTITNPATKQTLKVADYVNYDPTLNATGDTTYSSPASATGADSAQAFDAATYKNAGFSWRVLDVKNGQVRLIADTDVGPGDYSENATYYRLKGQAGYINGKNELNTICGIFGHGKGAASATSITVDDINAITGYNPKSPRYNQGSWNEYESEVTYTRGDGSALSSSAKLKSTKDPLTWNGTQSTFKYYNGTEFVDLTGSTTITSTYYSKNYNDDARKTGVLNADGTFSAPYEILFGKYKYDVSNNYDRSFSGTREHSYWLASGYVNADGGDARWGLRCVYGTGVGSYSLYYSGGFEDGSSNGVRPVVSLKSDVQLKWNETANEWQIQ